MPGYSFQSQVGAPDGTVIAAVDQSGFLAFGPWVQLPPGKYEASFSYEFSGTDPSASYVEVFSRDTVLAKEPIRSGSHVQTLAFELSSPLPLTEFRVFHGGQGRLAFRELSVDRR